MSVTPYQAFVCSVLHNRALLVSPPTLALYLRQLTLTPTLLSLSLLQSKSRILMIWIGRYAKNWLLSVLGTLTRRRRCRRRRRLLLLLLLFLLLFLLLRLLVLRLVLLVLFLLFRLSLSNYLVPTPTSCQAPRCECSSRMSPIRQA
jgi:hypothetical protein